MVSWELHLRKQEIQGGYHNHRGSQTLYILSTASDEVNPMNLDVSLSALCKWIPLLLLVGCALTLLTQPLCFVLLNFNLHLHLHLHHHTREELHHLLDVIRIAFKSSGVTSQIFDCCFPSKYPTSNVAVLGTCSSNSSINRTHNPLTDSDLLVTL